MESNIQTNVEILKQLEKGLLQMEFNQLYLQKFLTDGKLNEKDLLEFYTAEDIKEKFKAIEGELISKI